MADEIDSRMEQIRLKNEELEKKHKEILEDELEAKKQNAAIENYSSGSNYKHPYDELELDFDVKDEERQEHSKNSNAKIKSESSCFLFISILTHPKLTSYYYSCSIIYFHYNILFMSVFFLHM